MRTIEDDRKKLDELIDIVREGYDEVEKTQDVAAACTLALISMVAEVGRLLVDVKELLMKERG